MDERIKINARSPLGIYINGRPVLAVMVNGARMWPVESNNNNEDIDISAVLSCFGMGMWVDDLTWNDKAIWSD